MLLRSTPRLPSLGHEDRLTVVGHLEELRTRMIVSLLALAVAFAICFSQNHRLLGLINAPLTHETQQQVRHGHGPIGATYTVALSVRDIGEQLRSVAGALDGPPLPPAAREALAATSARLNRDLARLSAVAPGDRPVTLGIGEPFTTTVTVSLVFALILALPVIFGQACGFLAPAIASSRRRQLRPLAAAIPPLFLAGAGFGYFVVLPAAVHFLQNFNSAQFNVLVQASQYYRFAAITLLAMGLVFEMPVVILLLTGAGIVTPQQLRRRRRYAVAACAALAALLPGDASTMLLETVPLYLLFEISVAVAAVLRHDRIGSAAAA